MLNVVLLLEYLLQSTESYSPSRQVWWCNDSDSDSDDGDNEDDDDDDDSDSDNDDDDDDDDDDVVCWVKMMIVI